MKKFMKSLLLTGICASIMVSGFAFADSDITKGESQRQNNRPHQERMTGEEREEKQEKRQESREERQAKHDERQEKLMETVNEYASNLSGDFEAAFNEGKELHAQLAELKESNKPTDEEREAMKATFESIKEKVQSGEMTKEEAKEEMQSLRPERPNHDGEKLTEDEREAKRAEHEAKREEFKTAIENGDEDTIVEHLEEILENIQERNAKLAEKIESL